MGGRDCLGGSGAMDPRKFSKLGCSDWVKMTGWPHYWVTKFPELSLRFPGHFQTFPEQFWREIHWNTFSSSITFHIIHFPRVFQDFSLKIKISLRFWQFFKFPEFSRFSMFSRFVATLNEFHTTKFPDFSLTFSPCIEIPWHFQVFQVSEHLAKVCMTGKLRFRQRQWNVFFKLKADVCVVQNSVQLHGKFYKRLCNFIHSVLQIFWSNFSWVFLQMFDTTRRAAIKTKIFYDQLLKYNFSI